MECRHVHPSIPYILSAASQRSGAGEVREPRLYQLIRQKGQVGDRTFEIEFLDPGLQVFSFTLNASQGEILG
jgi:Thioredoxin like C-terminal domain